MEGVGRKRERGENRQTHAEGRRGGGAARETGDERDRGAARGTRLGTRALPAGRNLVMPGETSSSDSLYLLSYILWGPSFALGQ